MPKPIELRKSQNYNDSTPEKNCPTKVLNSGTVIGIFLGTECGDYCYTSIKLDSGEEIYYLAGGDVQDFTGKVGSRVFLTFDKSQFYMEEAEECVIREVFQSIKPVVKH